MPGCVAVHADLRACSARRLVSVHGVDTLAARARVCGRRTLPASPSRSLLVLVGGRRDVLGVVDADSQAGEDKDLDREPARPPRRSW